MFRSLYFCYSTPIDFASSKISGPGFRRHPVKDGAVATSRFG
jgi:hypothetical protein